MVILLWSFHPWVQHLPQVSWKSTGSKDCSEAKSWLRTGLWGNKRVFSPMFSVQKSDTFLQKVKIQSCL